MPDCLADGRVSVGTFVPCGGENSHKSEAEWFEGQLMIRDHTMGQLVALFWPGKRVGDVFFLTTSTSSGTRPDSPAIQFWDSSRISL